MMTGLLNQHPNTGRYHQHAWRNRLDGDFMLDLLPHCPNPLAAQKELSFQAVDLILQGPRVA
jgi:hypothetical protein